MFPAAGRHIVSTGEPMSLRVSSLCSVAVGVGFYGNSETNDGVYQLTYSLYNANHSLAGVESLVGDPAQENVNVRQRRHVCLNLMCQIEHFM